MNISTLVKNMNSDFKRLNENKDNVKIRFCKVKEKMKLINIEKIL